jgi:hypothetical protein
MTTLFGVFIYWGLNNSNDDDIFEFCGAFENFDDARKYETSLTRELKLEHSFSHAIIKPIDVNKPCEGEYKK